MAAFDFPPSPALGEKYPVTPLAGQNQYTWEGQKWAIDPAVVSDTTAPILSALTGGETGATAASYTVSTNEGNGAIWWVVVPTAAPPPSPPQIIAGTDGAGTPATDKDTQPVFGTGVQGAMTPNGLVAGTAYDFYVVHRDAANNISSSLTDEFVTVTVDTVGPTIVTVSPVDNATGVSPMVSLLIAWSEPVFAPPSGTSSVHVHRVSDNTTVQTWLLADLGTKWAISGTGTALSFDEPLEAGTEYYVIVGAGFVRDAAGNGSANYPSTTAWTFTTLAIAAPSVALAPEDDTAPLGDDTTTVENPLMDVNFNGVTTVMGGKLYIRTNGVIESMGGLGYHALTGPEAGGANITLTGMTALVAPGVYTVEAKYETSAWGTLYTLTIAAGGGSADATAEVAAWKAEVISVSGAGSATVSAPQEARVKTLMEALMNAGAWPLFDRIWVTSTENFKQSQVCLKSLGILLQGGTGLVFNPVTGIGNPLGTGYALTDFNPTVGTPNYTQNSAHHSVQIFTTTGVTAGPIIAFPSAPGSSLYPKFNDGNTYSRVNDNPESAGFANAGTQKGYWFSNRSSSTARSCEHDGVSIGTFPSVPSIAPLNSPFVMFGDGSGFDTCDIGVVTWGGSMDATMRAAVRAAFTAYFVSNGAPI